MAFVPQGFVGKPLDELLAVLPRVSPRELPAGEVALHHVGLRAMPTRHGDSRLPLDHPEIDVPGVVLDEYLGGGGQGCVYAGRVIATGKTIAVKLLAGDGGRGIREALLAGRVRHPNVLRILRAQPVGEFCVVLMELIQGRELNHDLPGDRRRCFEQLALGVSALGQARLVHRDVKPANVLIRDADQSPVLVDFGLAVDLRSPDDIEDDAVSGTPFFLAPEAWRDLPPNPSWDAYALGVTATVVLTQFPDPTEDLSTLRHAKLSGAFDRSLAQAIERIDDERLRDWITELVSPDESRRLAALAEGPVTRP